MNIQLSVLANKAKGCLVANLEALDSRPSVRRFIGWQFNPALGQVGGWEAKAEPELLNVSKPDHLQCYVKALKDGELLPANEATAKLAGLIFTNK